MGKSGIGWPAGSLRGPMGDRCGGGGGFGGAGGGGVGTGMWIVVLLSVEVPVNKGVCGLDNSKSGLLIHVGFMNAFSGVVGYCRLVN